jgi:hypothetical protein
MSKVEKIIILVLGLLCLSFLGHIVGPTQDASAVAAKPSSSKPDVGAEVPEAYFNHVFADASWPCRKAVENAAKYDLRWTDGWLSPAFSRWNKYMRADGLMFFYGDRAEAQNGFGAWLRVNYVCRYDPATKRVVGASFEQGRLRDL